jgi:hypothetical protein
MSNIYNRRLEYQINPKGKAFLEIPNTTVYPKYAVIGNTKPNLDYRTNRMLQPIFQTKKPIAQGPYIPKEPINAHGLGGKKPVYIDYVTQPLASFKTRPPKGLVWEPNSIRETRQNVYPDGVPKNLSQLQQADSQYLENLNNNKKQKQLEAKYEERRKAGGHDGSRPHPTPSVEEELKRLDDMLAETKYGKGPYKNIGLNAEQHRQMAEKEAQNIRKELEDLRKEALVHKNDVVDAIVDPTGLGLPSLSVSKPPPTALSDDDLKELVDDPKKLSKFLTDYTKGNMKLPLSTDKDYKNIRTAYLLSYLSKRNPAIDLTDKNVLDQTQLLMDQLGYKMTNIREYNNKIQKLLSKSGGKYSSLK